MPSHGHDLQPSGARWHDHAYVYRSLKQSDEGYLDREFTITKGARK